MTTKAFRDLLDDLYREEPFIDRLVDALEPLVLILKQLAAIDWEEIRRWLWTES